MPGQFFGDVSPEETWRALRDNPKAVLVDVRTKAEWAYVGGPDLTSLKRPQIRIEWQSYPALDRNRSFAEELVATGVRHDQPIYLICRSGVRSKHAAELLAARGYQTFNVADGFEGQLDHAAHRGGSGGWKVAGLPWKQS